MAGGPMADGGRAVAVTGVGLVAAPGIGLDAAWERLRRDPPRATPWSGPPPTDRIEFPLFRAPEYDLEAVGVPARCRRWLADEGLGEARDLHHLLAATALALGDAGLGTDCSELDPPAAVVVGDESPGFEELSLELFRLGLDAPFPGGVEERFDRLTGRFFRLSTFLPPYWLARAFGFAGLGLFVNSACTSGLSALDVAAGEVRSGRSGVAVAAAADNPLSAAKFLWFDRLGLYARDGVIRPFDPGQRGLVLGDGGAALVLEDAAAARARGARIYAEYAGAAFAQDGWKITVPSPVKGSAEKAVRRALAAAGAAPAEVDLVVPHGAGSPASDGYEARELERVFGAGGAWPAVAALKPLVGHNLGGSALVDAALLLAAMDRGEVPPTLGHERPYPRHALPLTAEWRRRPLRLAVKLSCGFAGFCGAAVFRRPAEEAG